MNSVQTSLTSEIACSLARRSTVESHEKLESTLAEKEAVDQTRLSSRGLHKRRSSRQSGPADAGKIGIQCF